MPLRDRAAARRPVRAGADDLGYAVRAVESCRILAPARIPRDIVAGAVTAADADRAQQPVAATHRGHGGVPDRSGRSADRPPTPRSTGSPRPGRPCGGRGQPDPPLPDLHEHPLHWCFLRSGRHVRRRALDPVRGARCPASTSSVVMANAGRDTQDRADLELFVRPDAPAITDERGDPRQPPVARPERPRRQAPAGQPPMADIGRSGCRKPGRRCRARAACAATAPRQPPASSSSSAPAAQRRAQVGLRRGRTGSCAAGRRRSAGPGRRRRRTAG